jgi:hypothetical protein
LYLRFEKKLTSRRLVVLGLLAGLSFLTQVISSALFAAIFFLLLLKKIKVKGLLAFSIPFFICVALYFLYGAYFGWDTFVKINLLQGARPIGPLTFWYIFSTPIIINKVYFDGWYLFGFLSLLLYFFSSKDWLTRLLPLFYLLFLLVTLTERGQSGWYIIPLFPFMALSFAKSIVDSIRAKSLFYIVFLLFAGLYELHILNLSSLLYRFAIFLLFGPFLLSLLPKGSLWYRAISYVLLVLLLLGNAFITWHYVHPA